MCLRAIGLREDLCNIFVTNGGFAHILCQNGAKTLSKDLGWGLFWRKNFVKLQKEIRKGEGFPIHAVGALAPLDFVFG